MYDYREWRHVFKLDPNKEINDSDLEAICESGTDAVMIGGTDGVTLEGVLDLMQRTRRYSVPCVLEVSSVDTVTPGFDLYFIPTVLNSRNPKWIVQLHQQAVKEYGEIMDWDEIHVEGYCIMNKQCKAAEVTDADADLTADDVVAYAQMAERMFSLPIFYLEYSGAYGDPQMAKKVKEGLEKTIFFYGGGITDAQKAEEMGKYADVIIVGNVIYENMQEALKTVKAVKG
ncbi:heptaprenylglyceryl phosphate synthase [Bacillus sp. 1P06AnD]|uniref:heptaprenylglyceryl phosphate synthase n=1 Tax=Bacillus sp. 1P06AnD TaxID=3132208 RepID=UPI00399F41BD